MEWLGIQEELEVPFLLLLLSPVQLLILVQLLPLSRMAIPTSTSSASQPKKRFTNKNKSSASTSILPRTTAAGPIPSTLFENAALNAAITTLLPINYRFEIHKTIHHIRHFEATCVALQMPEGLTLWATAIADIIETFTNSTTVIMGDVTYGACCVDDYTAIALGCDFLVHYGHSCLVPVDQTMLRTLYIFVEISVDSPHLSSTIRTNFPSKKREFRRKILGIGGGSEGKEKGKENLNSRFQKIEIESPSIGEVFSTEGKPEEVVNGNDETEVKGMGEGNRKEDEPTHFVLVATVQFIGALQGLRESLERSQFKPLPTHSNSSQNRLMIEDERDFKNPSSSSSPPETETETSSSTPWYSTPYKITIPQSKPLSKGEVLGCTSPNFSTGDLPDALIYLGDGRFHLESAMIANPRIPAFRYDPYEKRLVRERYDHGRMKKERGSEVDRAMEGVRKVRKERKIKEEMKIEFDSQKEGDGDEKMEAERERHRERDNSWGLILGTLGRQGSLKVLNHLQDSLIINSNSNTNSSRDSKTSSFKIPSIPILLSELSPQKLSLFGKNIETFVQTSCPRLSIDWGMAFEKPLLSPYEAAVALGRSEGWNRRTERAQGQVDKGKVERGMLEGEREGKGDYPMDFYSDNSEGPWTPRHGMGMKKEKSDPFPFKRKNKV